MLLDLFFRRISGLLLFRGDFFTHFLPPNLSDRAQDRVYMAGSELINGILDRFIDIATINGAFDQSSRLASITR